MKHRIIALLACLLSLAMLGACAKPAEDAIPSEEAAASEQMTGMPSPIHEVATYTELLAAVPGTMLSDAPENAVDVIYSYIDGEPVISQIQFTLDGYAYSYRAAQADEAAQSDIAGIYYDLNEQIIRTVPDGAAPGGDYKLQFAKGATMGLATWYYTPTGCQYSLWSETGCDASMPIDTLVNALLPITDTAAETTVQGIVVRVEANVLTLQLENSSTLQFQLTNIPATAAKAGDIVEVVYSGDPLSSPEAIRVTVLSSMPSETTVSGTVANFSATSVFIQTSGTNSFGFVIDKNTAFKGLSTTLKTGNQVTITYSGNISDSPLATIIETTAISNEPTPTPVPDEPVNSTVTGVITDLSSRSLRIYTDKGYTYTFKRSNASVVAGRYALEYGCRACVYFDGYAKNSPLAKRIEVLDPPVPTSAPTATPYVPQQYTIEGTVTMHAGNALVVDAYDGAEYSFLLRAPRIDGTIYEGDIVSLTYQVEADGSLNAIYIKVVTPIVYDDSGDDTIYDEQDYADDTAALFN